MKISNKSPTYPTPTHPIEKITFPPTISGKRRLTDHWAGVEQPTWNHLEIQRHAKAT
jgi:hypothetical protein